MRKSALFPVIFLFISITWGLYAQNNDMPHVTQINIEARNNLIRLTWVDSPEARGPVYIYRSTRPFAGSIPANIRPIIVRYGTQYYIDDTDDIGNLYYFIAASDTLGRRYDIILPRINSANVNFSEPDEEETLPVIALPEPVLIEGISNLRTVLDGEKVTISFNNTNPERNTILYRSSQPVRRPYDLINAGIVHRGTNSEFIDYPVPGQAWYYALVYEDEVSGGNIGINPGVNTTTAAVIVLSDQADGRSMRPIPLPELTLSEMTGGFLSNQIIQIPLGTESIDMLRNTPLPHPNNADLRRPRVFVVDLQPPTSGEESALYNIIKLYFETFDWENAKINLQHFLSLPRSKDIEARARFYLGQSFYFLGNYREALWEFLSFRAYNEIEANIWIDAVLAAMVN